jgi:hypothetical protein
MLHQALLMGATACRASAATPLLPRCPLLLHHSIRYLRRRTHMLVMVCLRMRCVCLT